MSSTNLDPRTAAHGATDVGAGANAADRAAARRLSLPVGVLVLAVSATLSVLNHNSVGEIFVDVGLELVAAIVLFVIVIPRALHQPSAGKRALVFGIVALGLTFPAFWSGLPLSFGAAAALLGWAGRRGTRGAGLSIAAFALGLLGVIGYAAMYITDAVIH